MNSSILNVLLVVMKKHLEADIVFELFDEEFEEYPLLTCPHCGNETFIPTSILEDFNLKKS